MKVKKIFNSYLNFTQIATFAPVLLNLCEFLLHVLKICGKGKLETHDTANLVIYCNYSIYMYSHIIYFYLMIV